MSQLNWRGDNKFVHLQGASPMLPPDHLTGPTGQETLRNSVYDFSVRQPTLTDQVSLPRPTGSWWAWRDGRADALVSRPYLTQEIADGKVLRDRTRAKPFAQYTVVRGYDGDELQQLGEILEPSTGLKEPLAVW